MNILIKQGARVTSGFLNTGILPAEWNDREAQLLTRRLSFNERFDGSPPRKGYKETKSREKKNILEESRYAVARDDALISSPSFLESVSV